MGEEIQTAVFSKAQFREFERRLREETQLLAEQLHEGLFDESRITCGFETEAWLLNADHLAAPANKRLLALAEHPLLFPELAQFNFEINGTPRRLGGNCLSQAQRELQSILDYCDEVATNLDARPGLFGILPTLRPSDLTVERISESNRFTALNEQVLSQRRGRPLKVDISGQEHLRLEHRDVMLEAATTSFQVHLQVPASAAARYYNASLQVSAPLVAVGANSPFLFGKHLFCETRIPLFEQAVEVGGYAAAAQGPLRRVSFGSSYLKRSIIESFEENLEHFPPLLPTLFDAPPEHFKHLRLHNGTIWRWNRPLIGAGGHGTPHVRIEHRVLPAGPSLSDMFANAAFYYGLVHALAEDPEALKQLSFAAAKDNFYKAVQHGLDAKITWMNNRTVWLKKLIPNSLVPLAEEGLAELGLSTGDRDYYLDIIRSRAETGRTGADWQVQFLRRTGADMRLVTETYLQHQRGGLPVHRWDLPAPPQKTQEPELEITDRLPGEFLETPARGLHTLLKGPTLFTLPGRRAEGMFVSVLLHGNEDSGLVAMQRVLRKYRGRTLPRPLYLFVGNIDAARYGLRRLKEQADYNRAWPGAELSDCSETRLLRQLHEFLSQQTLLLSIDLHNNTGLNPQYACVNRLDPRFLHLALLFSRTVVYFTRPRGVQSAAMAELCPAVTVECGKVGDRSGIDHAEKFIDVALNLVSLPEVEISERDIDLFHTVAQVKVPERIRFNFEDEPADVNFNVDLEYMNFREITPGTPFGDCANLAQPPLEVLNERGDDVYGEYFEVSNGLLRVTRPVMPSMLTLDERIIRQDCFCYLMERIAPGWKPRRNRRRKR